MLDFLHPKAFCPPMSMYSAMDVWSGKWGMGGMGKEAAQEKSPVFSEVIFLVHSIYYLLLILWTFGLVAFFW